MRKSILVAGLAAGLMAFGPVLAAEPGTAKLSTTGTVKPSNGPEEKSLPSSAPAATTTGTTGATNQSNTVKSMNSNEQAKVNTSGK